MGLEEQDGEKHQQMWDNVIEAAGPCCDGCPNDECPKETAEFNVAFLFYPCGHAKVYLIDQLENLNDYELENIITCSAEIAKSAVQAMNNKRQNNPHSNN